MRHSINHILKEIVKSEGLRISIAAFITLVFGSVLVFKSNTVGYAYVRSPDLLTQVSVALGGHHVDANPVALIDIDDATFRSWGSPAHLPRDRLAQLLLLAREGRPRAIVLDVDLSFDSEAEIEHLKRSLNEPDPHTAPVPIVLVRSFRRTVSSDPNAGLIDRRTVLDGQVANDHNKIWAAAYFEAEDDWLFRQWRGFRAVCSNGPPRAFPAIALALVALADPSGRGRAELSSWLERAAASACAVPRPKPVSRRDGEPKWLRNAGEAMIIPYTLGFSESVAHFGTTMLDGHTVPLFVRLQADALLKAGEPPDLKGRIAIIGATFEESRDLRRTPLGTMPGMYIIANTVALARATLAENRWGGMKPWSLGLAYFSLYLILALTLRGIFAALAVLLLTGCLAIGALLVGVSAHVAYEAAAAGFLLISLYAASFAFLGELKHGRRNAFRGRSRVARLLLSDRALRWTAVQKR